MEDEKKVIVQEEVPPLFTGVFFYFLLFVLLFYFASGGNYVYACVLAFFPVGIFANLAENRPARSIGFLAGFFVSLLWISLCKAVCLRILAACANGDKMLVKILNQLSSVMIVPEKISVLQTILFALGTIVIGLCCLKLMEVLPKKLEMSETLHKIMLFSIRFFQMLIGAIIINVIAYKVLAKLSYPPGFSFLICIFPFLFIFKTWEKAGEDIAKRNGSPSEEKSPIKKLDIPDTKLADVAGMEKVKEQIKLRMILPVTHPKEAARHGISPGGGLLLYGPPGTGKTFLARAVAGELSIPFFTITVADIFSKYIGESEKNLRAIFGEIRKNKLSVLFIDELESIFRSRNEDSHESTRKVISLLLQELDGIQKHDNNLLLIGATNTPHLLDEAFLRTGRLDVQIFVGLPDVAARQQILENCFKDVTYPVQKGLLAAVAAYTADYSGADLKGLAIKVKQLAFLRKTTYYSKELFEECLSDFRPAPCSQIIQQIREWEARWGR